MDSATLYRKYRPSTLDQVCGQTTIVRTLGNQMKAGTFDNAYLFHGPRGTGKTSIAKILAKTAICQNPNGILPCGKCPACQAYINGMNADIIELDAASNSGIDNIRQIIDQCVYAPMYGKHKVYIIDEVHGLSNAAFNALLKTLEEPPGHIIFILCTTEFNKVPKTIVSRCKVMSFKLLTEDEIVSRMKYILTQEQMQWDDDNTLYHIAKLANGGLRDALSLLGQIIDYCGNNIITKADVSTIGGEIQDTTVSNMIQAITNHRADALLSIIRKLENDGKTLDNIISSLFWEVKKQYFANQSIEYLFYLNILAELSEKIRYNSRIVFEMGMINLCNPPSPSQINSSGISHYCKNIVTEVYNY